MREPEFLPSWYGLLLRRRTALAAQAWLTAVLIAGLGVWTFIGQRQTQAASGRLDAVQTQLNQTGVDLAHLNEIEAVKHELEHQDHIVRLLGVHVPASRVLAALDELMPPQMALLGFQLKTEETTLAPTAAQSARGQAPQVERKLRLTLTGVAPSEDELATFLTKLVGVPYFAEVELVKAEDHSENSHLTRQFEAKFALNLDTAPTAVAGGGDESATGDQR